MNRTKRLRLSTTSSTEDATQSLMLINEPKTKTENKRRTRSQGSKTPKKQTKPIKRVLRKATNKSTRSNSSKESINSSIFDETDVEVTRKNDKNSNFAFDPSDGYDETSKTKRSSTTNLYSLPSCSKSSPNLMESGKSEDDELNLHCESSDEEWEEVANEEEEEKEVVIPKNGVEVTLAAEDVIKKRKKKTFDWNDYARLCVNRFKKEVQQDLHKVHVMCLLSHGFFINNQINSELMMGLVLSIIPENFLKFKPKKVDLSDLNQLISWFQREFRFDLTDEPRKKDFLNCMIETIGKRTVLRCVDCVVILICVFRVLGFDSRLIFSMQPISGKPNDLIKPKPNEQNIEKKTTNEIKEKKPKNEPKINEKIKKREIASRKATKKIKIIEDDDEDDEDDDFEPKISKRRSRETSVERIPKNRSRKKTKMENVDTKNDYWAEIYLEKKSEWICVDCINCRIVNYNEIEPRATQPLIYVISFDNNNKIKDLTQRYANNWLSINYKLRFDVDWLTELIKPFKPRLTNREKKENSIIQETLLKKPLPKTISEFKGHPLYALPRHLLKFEAIYPPESVPLGFIRSEPIYSRDCIHTLHSRETWLKQAKIVKIGEKPYKIVKARPKWNKMTRQTESNLPLDVFGFWQIKDYEPPVAVDGKVPRNEYGNVDLFQESMLPIGTVHIRVPRLLKVARKLGIDCVPAMTGWDFRKTGNTPVFDGWVVCEEFKDTLMEAWRHQMKLDYERVGEKREKRIYGNWRRLIRAVLIREKLAKKYFK